MASHPQPLWAFVVFFVLLIQAAAVVSQEITTQHSTTPTTCPLPCPSGQTCSCTCQWRSKSRAAVDTSTAGTKWLDIGAICQMRRSWDTARCRPGSRCTCGCTPAPSPAAVATAEDDTFVFEDPDGPEGPGNWTVSVLENDITPDGTPPMIAAGSVVLLPSSSPGVSIVSVDESNGLVVLSIPDGAEVVEFDYAVQSSGGPISAPARVQGVSTGAKIPNEYPIGTCTTTCRGAAVVCPNQKNRQCGKPAACHCLAWANSKSQFKVSDAYAMFDFRLACDNTNHTGCNRCAIYHIMKECSTAKPSASECVLNDKTNGMVIVRARNDVSGKECVMNNHFLMMPHTACTGVDDPNSKCRGDSVKNWWQAGYKFAVKQGLANPAMFINQPEERGQQHMHIHIATIDKSGPLNKVLSGFNNIPAPGTPSKPNKPAIFLSGTNQMLAYRLNKTDWVNTSPTHLAKQIHFTHYGTDYNKYSFGVVVIPDTKGGAAVVTVYGFSDREALDVSTGKTDCVAPCLPITNYA